MPTKTAQIFNLEGKPTGTTNISPVFDTPLRPDVIKRAVLSIQSHRIQPQGRDPMAGKRTSAQSRGTGMGIARVPREKGGGGKAAFAPGTVGGRQAHPPRAETCITKEIPKKEKRLALLSAIAATSQKDIVSARGHKIEAIPEFPLIVENSFENLTKAKEVDAVLASLGLSNDVNRVRESRKVRAGKGKFRGRKMKQAVGPLIIVAEEKGLMNAAKNLAGIDIVNVSNINVELLAPGTHPGRLTLWTDSAINQVEKLYGEGVEA
ncbi:MAG: 50S ribosomal protein L4 [Crenarchaeota archaeon]|nr:50S ribosomal protein L4 [Thermoproteota archaeon]